MAYPRENTIPFSHVGGANAACVATSPAPGTNNRLRLKYVVASYSGAPTGGQLTITDGTLTWVIDITGSGPIILPNLDVQCAAGAAITITLAAAGAGVIGKVNAYATYE